MAGCTEVSVQQSFPTIFATNDGRTPTLGPKIMHRSVLPIFYCQIPSEKGGGSVTERIQYQFTKFRLNLGFLIFRIYILTYTVLIIRVYVYAHIIYIRMYVYVCACFFVHMNVHLVVSGVTFLVRYTNMCSSVVYYTLDFSLSEHVFTGVSKAYKIL